MKIIGYSAVPLDKFRIEWIPICGESAYENCHKNSEGDCGYFPQTKKSQCRKIQIEIQEVKQ